jgi:hypothetical protein
MNLVSLYYKSFWNSYTSLLYDFYRKYFHHCVMSALWIDQNGASSHDRFEKKLYFSGSGPIGGEG